MRRPSSTFPFHAVKAISLSPMNCKKLYLDLMAATLSSRRRTWRAKSTAASILSLSAGFGHPLSVHSVASIMPVRSYCKKNLFRYAAVSHLWSIQVHDWQKVSQLFAFFVLTGLGAHFQMHAASKHAGVSPDSVSLPLISWINWHFCSIVFCNSELLRLDFFCSAHGHKNTTKNKELCWQH